jgi:UDP-sugar diphosphatase
MSQPTPSKNESDLKSDDVQNHKIDSFELVELTNSAYINPYRLKFNQNGHKRVWDGIMSHSGVSCIIYERVKKCIILVRQFRPVVFVNLVIEAAAQQAGKINDPKSSLRNLDWSRVDPSEAVTFEFCAGICDKSKTLEETVKEEIFEECGYTVDLANIHRVRQSRAGVGLLGSLHTIFYAEVDDSMKTGSGGGNANEGEFVELFELNESKIREFIDDESRAKPPGLLYGLMWFLYEREQFMKNKK